MSLDPPASLADLFASANKYVFNTEVMRVVGGNEDREQKRKERDVEEDSSRVRGSDVPWPQFHHYTKLLQPQLAILATIKGSGLIRVPKKIDHPMGRNKEEHCRYHKTRGHSTDQCRELKNQIEMLIREGHLQRYVRNKEEEGREPQRREDMHKGHER